MHIDLASMALEMPHVSAHPNRKPFRGILTLVDVASDRAPSGSRGRRVLLTRAAAEAAIPSLLGMGLDYTASFDGHDVRRKVGIITQADIVTLPVEAQGFSPAKQLKREGALAPAAIEVHGFLFARDFPDVVREIAAASKESKLGMSYEIANASIANLRDPVWRLTDVTFTGAAVLRREKAAYSKTSIELVPEKEQKELAMNEEVTQQFLSTAARLAAAAESLQQAISQIEARNEALTTKVDRIIAAVEDEGRTANPAHDARVAELERANAELKAQAARASARKTLPPLVTALLAKSGLEAQERIDPSVLDKTLSALSVEQRIAVKGQMARAGIID